MDEFNRECLEKHNFFRAKHGCPALTYSEELRNSAQTWAEEMARQGQLAHSEESKGKRGENVGMKFVEGGTQFTGSQATCNWYSEIKDFEFGKENQINCGHFSQVVWKSTTHCGFGRKVHTDGRVFVCGQYLPGANTRNKWNENIPKPCNGRVECPTEEEIMGPKPKPKPAQGGSTLQGEGDHDPDDVLVGKQTKNKTSGGVKTSIITETYQKPDGSTYQVTIQKKSGLEEDLKKLKLAEKNKEKDLPKLGQDTGNFVEDVLDAHNSYRKLHGVPPLRRNEELDKLAQEWADHLAATNGFSHSTNTYKGSKLGENVACQWGSGVTSCKGKDVVYQWYSEEPKCIYGENPKQLDAGHFTQVVWKESQELGTGYAVDSNGKHLTVCNYHPAGNMMGKFPDMVLPPV